jgi:diguanylate cyclase (GGDEF)-like protein
VKVLDRRQVVAERIRACSHRSPLGSTGQPSLGGPDASLPQHPAEHISLHFAIHHPRANRLRRIAMNNLAMNKCLLFVSEILNVLRSTSQYEKVLHLIVDRLVRVYKCQTCAVVLINPKTEFLNIENSFGLSLTFCKAFRRKLATGTVGELLWTGKPVIIRDSKRESQRAEELQLEHPFGSCIAVQIAIDHRTMGYLFADRKDIEAFAEDDVRVFQAFADFAGIAIQKTQLHDENMRLERIDRETGLEKYGPFIEKLRASMERGVDFREKFAVLILDVDNFKTMAQTYGYDSSKQFLKELGELVKGKLRGVDAGARYGYDEFILLLANTDLDEAVCFAKQLAGATEHAQFTEHNIQSTISIGLATYPENGKTIDDLLLTAKNALFEAQRAGRNKVFHYISEWYAKDAVLYENS